MAHTPTDIPWPTSLIDLLPFGVALTSREGQLLRWNRWLAERLVPPPREGDTLQAWVVPEKWDALTLALERAVQGVPTLLSYRVHQGGVLRLRQADNPEQPLAHNLHILPWYHQEQLRGILLFVQDLSDRLLTEQALRRQVSFLQLLAGLSEKTFADDLKDGLAQSLEQLIAHFDAKRGALYLHGPGTSVLRKAAAYGCEPPETLPAELQSKASVVWAATAVWQRKRGLLETWGEGHAPIYHPLAPESRSLLAHPVLAPQEESPPLGIVVLESDRPAAFTQTHLQQLRVFCEHLGLNLALRLAYERERQARRLAETLHAIGLRLVAEQDPQRVMETILDSVAEVVPYDSGNIMVVEDDHLRIAVARGYERFGIALQALLDVRFPFHEFANLRHIARTHEPLIIPDTLEDPYWIRLEASHHVRSWIGVPILVHERLLGILCLDSIQPHFYTHEHAHILQAFAAQAGLALDNARRYTERYQQAITDPLTSVFNRRHFNEQIQREVARSLRFSRPLSVIMLDIDDFKRYNDTFGHPAGDMVLQAVAAVLKHNLRAMDLVARYGGEEFVVMLPETGANAALRTAERLRKRIASLHEERPDLRMAITVSLGVATLPDHAQTVEDLILAADVALYHAKTRGKNCAVVYSEALGTLAEAGE